VAAGDLDGDSYPDLAGESLTGTLTWWQSDGSPADGGWSAYEVAAGLGRLGAVAITDLDGDSSPDLLAASADQGTVTWWRSDGSPADGGWQAYPLVSDLPGAHRLARRPGRRWRPGLAAAGMNRAVGEQLGPAAGDWTSTCSAWAWSGPSDLAIAALARDCDPDVLAGLTGDLRLLWWQNRLLLLPPWFRRAADYDSGWLDAARSADLLLEHHLLGNPDNYVVRLEFLATYSTASALPSAIHQLDFGGDAAASGENGAYWLNLDEHSIQVHRTAEQDSCPTCERRVRLRIWNDPQPDFDSGWLDLSAGSTLPISHSLGGDPSEYVVDLQFQDTDQPGDGRNQHGYGGDNTGADVQGAWWEGLTDTQVTVGRAPQDSAADQVRLRIWRDPQPSYDSSWLAVLPGETTLVPHNLGGLLDDYVVDVQFRDPGGLGVHQLGFGGDRAGAATQTGGGWSGFSASALQLQRAAQDTQASEMRARLWRIPARQWDSGWRSERFAIPQDLGGLAESYLVYMAFRDNGAGGAGINQLGYGQDRYGEGLNTVFVGGAWNIWEGDTSTIIPWIGLNDVEIDEFRIRIFEAAPALFDSQWLTLTAGTAVTWTHGLGSDPYPSGAPGSINDYLLDLTFRSPFGIISQYLLGGDLGYGGGYWSNLAPSNVQLYNEAGAGSSWATYDRLRLWMNDAPGYDSSWQLLPTTLLPLTLTHDLGGSPDTYIVDMQFWDDQGGAPGYHLNGQGGDRSAVDIGVGAYWTNLTASDISLWRWPDTTNLSHARLRIWDVSGPLASLVLRDAPLGGGSPVGDVALDTGQSITVYAAGYDANGAYLGDQWVHWTTTGSLDLQTGQGLSFTFTPQTSGSGAILASNGYEANSLSGSTGLITVTSPYSYVFLPITLR
jgi:hypothetical protein